MSISGNNNFELLRNELGLSNRDFSKLLGIGETTYTKLKKGTLPIGEKTIKKIRTAFPDINTDWILNNIGERINKNQTIQSNAKFVSDLTNTLEETDESEGSTSYINLGDGQYLMVIPFVNEYAYMGYLSGWADTEYIEELPKHSIIVQKYYRGKYRAFEAIGDSMENYTTEELAKESIASGSTVVGREIQRQLWTSKLHTHKWPDYIIVHKDGILIKRIIDHDVESGVITIHSLNPNRNLYPDKEIHLDDVMQIYNIIDVSKRR